MQVSDITLVGYLHNTSPYAEVFENEQIWASFCFNNCGIQKENFPKIDFATRKVVLVPSYFSHKKVYLVYSETLKDHIKKSLEINLLAFRSDAAAQEIFKGVMIVLSIPKKEKFHLFVNPHTHIIAEKDKELSDLMNEKEKILSQIKRIEQARMIIEKIFKSSSPELNELLNDLEAKKKALTLYDKMVKERVNTLRNTLCGISLNPKALIVSK